MPSELDRRFDAKLAELTGPDGRLVIGRDTRGQAIVENFPATLPELFRAFCALHAESEAIVAGDERLDFRRTRPHFRTPRSGAGGARHRQGRPHRHRHAQLPGLGRQLHGDPEGGRVATLINGWWEAQEMEHALSLTEPKLIIADAPRAQCIAARCQQCEIVTLPVERPVEAALAPLLDRAGEMVALPDIAAEDEATILFTSGSTGEAKGALSTHRAVTAATYCYATGLMVLRGILEDEGRPPATPRTLINVPLFHVTGEVPVMLNSFVVGRCMVMMPKWDAGEALRLIDQERITYFVGVPTMSLELMTHPDRHKYDLSSLKDITAGGAPRPVTHVERLREEFPGAKPALGYGLTETNAVGAMNFWENYAAKPGSTGRAARPYVEVSIIDDDCRHLPAGETGEIAIRTAAAIRSYWKAPEATSALFTADGFVRSGDIGYLDEDGYLFIVDRKKDIIIRGGENISAAEVEAACYDCADVGEVSVFAAPDERLGEVPVAVVLGRNGLTEEALHQFLEERIARFKIPARFIFSDRPLPRLGTGKIDRQALKARYAR